MRISDWSSDVCSSDLPIAELSAHRGAVAGVDAERGRAFGREGKQMVGDRCEQRAGFILRRRLQRDRKSVVKGKSGSVRVDPGGRRNIRKQSNQSHSQYYSHI